VQRFTLLLIDAARPVRHLAGDRWFVDETYVKVARVWRYVYRAVDQVSRPSRGAQGGRASAVGRGPGRARSGAECGLGRLLGRAVGDRLVADGAPVGSKHDLRARPIYHHKRESIDAHLTIVFAALAITRFIEDRTGWSIKKFVRTARRYRTVHIRAGQHLLTAEDPLPDDLRDALALIT